MTDGVRTLGGDIRISGKVKSANVTFAEVGSGYRPEPGTASREVTREELEYALRIISRWSTPRIGLWPKRRTPQQ